MKIASNVRNVLDLRDQSIGQARAREALSKMAAALTDGEGHIRSGYLRLSDSGVMNAGGFLTQGSHSSATSSVRNMLRMAYGERLGNEGSKQLDAAINAYLTKTGGAIGTRTFVKLVQTLESRATQGTVNRRSGPRPNASSRASGSKRFRISLVRRNPKWTIRRSTKGSKGCAKREKALFPIRRHNNSRPWHKR